MKTQHKKFYGSYIYFLNIVTPELSFKLGAQISNKETLFYLLFILTELYYKAIDERAKQQQKSSKETKDNPVKDRGFKKRAAVSKDETQTEKKDECEATVTNEGLEIVNDEQDDSVVVNDGNTSKTEEKKDEDEKKIMKKKKKKKKKEKNESENINENDVTEENNDISEKDTNVTEQMDETSIGARLTQVSKGMPVKRKIETVDFVAKEKMKKKKRSEKGEDYDKKVKKLGQKRTGLVKVVKVKKIILGEDGDAVETKLKSIKISKKTHKQKAKKDKETLMANLLELGEASVEFGKGTDSSWQPV